MERRWLRALGGAIVSLIMLGGSVSAGAGLSATLAGKTIRLEVAGALSCHDFDYPVLRCFSRPRALELEVARRVRAGAVPTFVVTAGYVTAYADASYDGSQVTMATDQPWLSSIGWNDRISSFKSFGATGRFRENSPNGGLIYTFGTTSQIPILTSTYNDKFSAFDIN